MANVPEDAASDGPRLFEGAINAAQAAAEKIEDAGLRQRVMFLMHDVRLLAAHVVDVARAEGTAIAVLPELVERGNATALPLAVFDKTVNDVLLHMGDVEQGVQASLQHLKDVARAVIPVEAELSRKRIEALGGPEKALRKITREILAEGPSSTQPE